MNFTHSNELPHFLCENSKSASVEATYNSKSQKTVLRTTLDLLWVMNEQGGRVKHPIRILSRLKLLDMDR